MLTDKEIQERFGPHSARIECPENQADHAYLRDLFVIIAEDLNQDLPEGRAKSIALTELESASMWAHKSLVNKEKN